MDWEFITNDRTGSLIKNGDVRVGLTVDGEVWQASDVEVDDPKGVFRNPTSIRKGSLSQEARDQFNDGFSFTPLVKSELDKLVLTPEQPEEMGMHNPFESKLDKALGVANRQRGKK